MKKDMTAKRDIRLIRRLRQLFRKKKTPASPLVMRSFLPDRQPAEIHTISVQAAGQPFAVMLHRVHRHTVRPDQWGNGTAGTPELCRSMEMWMLQSWKRQEHQMETRIYQNMIRSEALTEAIGTRMFAPGFGTKQPWKEYLWRDVRALQRAELEQYKEHSEQNFWQLQQQIEAQARQIAELADGLHEEQKKPGDVPERKIREQVREQLEEWLWMEQLRRGEQGGAGFSR